MFGGSGFIGTHLIRKLAQTSDAMIVSIDRRPATSVIPGVKYVLADVRDLSSLESFGEIERIYNFAAVHTTPGHPTHEYYDTNINGALEITRLAERSGVSEIIFTSSISVYGPSEETKTESSTPAPTSAYGYSKLLAENVHRKWLERDPAGRKLTIVRPAVVFGPGEGGNFTRMASLIRKGIFIYPGRKDTIKACIYVEDLLRAIEFARTQSAGYVLFNGAYDQQFTLQQIVETLINNHFPKAKTVLVPRAAVTVIAKILAGADFLHLGIHPDRVTKLVRSTDIDPAWLRSNQFEFPKTLDSVFARWSTETNGTFV